MFSSNTSITNISTPTNAGDVMTWGDNGWENSQFDTVIKFNVDGEEIELNVQLLKRLIEIVQKEFPEDYI